MLTEIFKKEHLAYKSEFEKFIHKDVLPFYSEWEKKGSTPRSLWLAAGRNGFLCPDLPKKYGGSGHEDYRYNIIINTVLSHHELKGISFALHNDVAYPYILKHGTKELKDSVLPLCAKGECILALALTEERGGSDLDLIDTKAVEKNGGYILNGTKKFISNAKIHDLSIVLAKTKDPNGNSGFSLLAVEADSKGYQKGPLLKKIGLHARDVGSLTFNDVVVPKTSLLGKKNRGLIYLVNLLPMERLSVSINALASGFSVFKNTVEYTNKRQVFKSAISRHQANGFSLVELKTELKITEAFIKECIHDSLNNTLTNEKAAMAKWWTTELLQKVLSKCIQLHGGIGYLSDSHVARSFVDNRLLTIYAGSNELLKNTLMKNLDI